MKTKRPKTVTWLAYGVLTLATLHLIRLVEIVQTWDYLQTLPISVSVPYLVLTALIWSVIGIAIFFGLWKGKNWASENLKVFSILFAIYFWVDHVFLGVDPSRNVSNPFKLFLTIAVLAVTVWVLSRPQSRLYFGELNE